MESLNPKFTLYGGTNECAKTNMLLMPLSKVSTWVVSILYIKCCNTQFRFNHPYNDNMIQSEKLCLKWHDFKDHTSETFKSFRDEPDFSDVTLVTKDTQTINAHRVILSVSSPVFHSILNNNKNMHPIIYIRGITSKNLLNLIDFIYYGEVYIAQEDLQEFMGIAQEFQVEGLENAELPEHVEHSPNVKSNKAFDDIYTHFEEITETTRKQILESTEIMYPVKLEPDTSSVVSENQEKTTINSKCQNHDLNEKISYMIKKNSVGFNCTMCGNKFHKKRRSLVVSHIETEHMNLSFPCVQCQSGKSYKSRKSLAKHKNFKHRHGSLI